jgi:uncharacterized damage-inducible protein DinB
VPRSSLGYLDYFRDRLISKLSGLPVAELSRSRLPSGWTPLELLRHLTFVERRWLEWGFAGQPVAQPWGDNRGDDRDERWFVPDGEGLGELTAALRERAAYSRAVIESHDLAEVGQPGERWDGADPATLERVLFHLLQEYARHVGQLDIVCEIAGGPVGE